MSDLSELFKVVSAGKKHFEDTTLVGQKIKETKEHVKEDLGSLFAQLSSLKEELEEELVIEEAKLEAKQEEMIVEDLLIETPPVAPEVRPASQIHSQAEIEKYLKRDASFQQPDPDLVSKNVDDIRNKIKFLEQSIGRIAAAGPGSGEVNLRWLDDVDRSTITDGRWLKYDGQKKKFVFDDINPYQVVYNTTHVTTPTYIVQDEDFYIGVDYAGPCTVTLPAFANSGRMITIKDEDGDAAINPITVLGTVDNDPGGFVIQINNGAIQMIYRDGWRII